MPTHTTSIVLLLSLALPAVAFADSPAERARVEALLLGYHSSPDRAALEAATPDPEGTLLGLLADKSRSPVVRLRVVDALGHVPSLRVRGVLHRMARSDAAPVVDRAHAATALLFAWGDGALHSVEPLLRAADPVLRLAVADGLVRYAGRAGRRAVRAALAREKAPALRDQLRALLDPRPVSGGGALR